VARAAKLPASGTPPLTTRSSSAGPVVIDALAARFGGTAYAAIEVAQRLADEAGDDEIVVVTREGSLIAEGVEARPGLRLVLLGDARRFELARRVLWEAHGLPKLVRRERASSVLSWSGMLPRAVGVPVVCYLANPLMFERRDAANRLRRWAARRTLRQASHVLVPTRATAVSAAEALGRPPEVVPFGVDRARLRPASEPGSDVLCVADFYPHKRQDMVLAAWAALPAPRPRLRLIGNPQVDRQWYETVRRQAERLSGLGEISFESGLSFEGIAEAYRGARAFALATHEESFCLPLLETQACGVPAVVRDLPVLREVGGSGTTYVEGDDPDVWAEALGRLLVDDTAHATARAAGTEHARRFSWDRTADAVRSRLVVPPAVAE
jgi:glycosyltransferase involved in cell wall biosynthesis